MPTFIFALYINVFKKGSGVGWREFNINYTTLLSLNRRLLLKIMMVLSVFISKGDEINCLELEYTFSFQNKQID